MRLVPSKEVGEYGVWEGKRTGPLFPLEEEGQYGPAPVYKTPGKWTGPPKYQKREKKPKVYASYNVNSECAFHGHKIGSYGRQGGRGAEEIRWKRSVSAPPPTSSKPPSRSGKYVDRQTSLPPYDPDSEESLELVRRLEISRTIKEDIQDSLLDKAGEEEDRSESDSTGDDGNRYSEKGGSVISLERSGEEGGELGLSTRLLREQRKRCETFMSSTGSFLREEPLTTYVI